MIPLIASIIGGVAPSIINALVGGKTEDEARRAVAPHHDALLMQLMSSGMSRRDAEAHADQALSGELEKARSEGPIPPWAEALLGAAGGIGGWAAGARLAKSIGNGASKVALSTTARPPFPASMTGNLAKDEAEALATTGAHYPGMWDDIAEEAAEGMPSKVGRSGSSAKAATKSGDTTWDEAETINTPTVDLATPETEVMGEAATKILPPFPRLDQRFQRTQAMPTHRGWEQTHRMVPVIEPEVIPQGNLVEGMATEGAADRNAAFDALEAERSAAKRAQMASMRGDPAQAAVDRLPSDARSLLRRVAQRQR